MFTGIISACALLMHIVENNGVRTCRISLPKTWKLQVGESINVDGVCSTVTALSQADFTVEYMPETLRVTTLKNIQENGIVNLERSLRMQDLLSGHMVSGHVDTVGIVRSVVVDGDSHVVTVEYPQQFSDYLISKGSVAVNGMSLTVVEPTDTTFSVAIIPYTWQHTTMRMLVVESLVNIEFDLVAKYIAKHFSHVNT